MHKDQRIGIHTARPRPLLRDDEAMPRKPTHSDAPHGGPRARDLRESYEPLRALVRRARHMSWTASANGLVNEMPMWCAYTGQSVAEARGWGWLAAVHPEDREHAMNVWAQALMSGVPFEVEFRIRRHDGAYSPWVDHGVPVLGGDGRVLQWVGLCAEKSERE